MAESEPPPTSDPGTNQTSRERWGKQILDAFAMVTLEVTDLKRTAQKSVDSLSRLDERVGEIDVNLGLMKQDITTWKKLNWGIIGAACTIIITLLSGGFVMISDQKAQTVKIDDMTKHFESYRTETKTQVSDLDKTVKSTNEAIFEFRRLLDRYDLNLKVRDEKLDRIEAFVAGLEKSKGESTSEFMSQRYSLTRSDLKPRAGNQRLLFTVKLPYESLSSEKPPRPSAALSQTHDKFLDPPLGFQIKVTGTTDSTLEVTLASDPPTIEAIVAFLDGGGFIPLDLTIRTPKQ